MSEQNGPPAPEPKGYAAVPGFVKSNPLNNDYYVEQFRDDPWYPIIKQTHERLTAVIPGYNIAQIKDKFGGLRYYFDEPQDSLEEKVKEARQIVAYATAWVDGFEYYRENNRATAN